MSKRNGTVARSGTELALGYYSKEEAARLRRILAAADVPARLRFDRAISERHGAATSIDPPIRRRSSYRDMKSGYFVKIPKAKLDAAKAALADTSFRHVFKHDADARLCAACERPLPSETDVCPHCEDSATGESNAERSVRRSSTVHWIAVILFLGAVGLLVKRTFR